MPSNALTSDQEQISFPEGFWWGTALSSHQSEGNNHNSWTEWEKTPGHIKNGNVSGIAANHWELFEEDFDRVKWLHADTHRLSIEWSRIEPQMGGWNKLAIDHYRRMLLSLKERRIRPIVTLFHFTLPIWAEEMGGFENPKVMEKFVEFAGRAQGEFGDLVGDWITLNEPVVYALAGYGAGLTPPGAKDIKRAFRIVANLMRVHGDVYHVIKGMNRKARVSFAQHLRVFDPGSVFSPFDWIGARIADEIFNWSWYRSIIKGKIEIRVPGLLNIVEDCPQCLGALDFLSFNYYGRDLITLKPWTEQKFFVSVKRDSLKSDMGWEVYPEGLSRILRGIKDHGLGHLPLLITENGIADSRDDRRPGFIHDHLKAFLTESEKLGLKPMGFLYWSLIDNFEWIDGYYPRFGLFEVNYGTQARAPRESARYFRALGAARRVLEPP